VAVNLALTIDGEVQLLDCDVEEPDCHLFLSPQITRTTEVGVPFPVVDEEACTGCGLCGDFCQHNAIVSLGGSATVFPELCHGCGGCLLVCPAGALHEETRSVGVVEQGRSGSIEFLQGRLNVGEAMSPPVIRSLKASAHDEAIVILDSPPGTACPMVEAANHADFALLVTEPTPFGLHDLKLAVEVLRLLAEPFGVVINRDGIGDREVEIYCKREGIPILMSIPYDRRIAVAYSKGEPLVQALPEYRARFAQLAATLTAEAIS